MGKKLLGLEERDIFFSVLSETCKWQPEFHIKLLVWAEHTVSVSELELEHRPCYLVLSIKKNVDFKVSYYCENYQSSSAFI